ncbi:hypothetical protein ACS0TY_009136 [Phlomoides rotata]
MNPNFFPLRWESTGEDQWWFASPIDFASANGHYDLVKQLLRIDSKLLVKLTSLPRLRRLETVWDEEFTGVAKCRSEIARKLFDECESSGGGYNSLMRGGYGGWLLYTAACGGDVSFVRELLDRDPLLVFGEGEYGVSDMLYAACRSRSEEVFKVVFDCSAAKKGPPPQREVFRWEMMNRAVHAAARGGSVVVLRDLLGNADDVLGFRDALGSTVLHSAAARGQVPVVKDLLSSYNNIIDLVDDRGNTALNIAAYRGHLPVFKVLISAFPSLASMTNNYGDTFLHMAVAGFCTPSFRRLDRQIQLVQELVGGAVTNMEHIINVQNNDGRTALHTAVIDNVRSDVVELLFSVRCIDLNVIDREGNTPLDLLYQVPRTPCSEILIKRVVSAGGVSGFQDQTAKNSLVSNARMHGIGGSPGTSFRIPDAEIVLHAGIEEIYRSSCQLTYSENGYSGEIKSTFTTPETSSSRFRKSSTMNSATRRLKNLLRLGSKTNENRDLGDDYSVDSCRQLRSSPRNGPIPLREQFSGQQFHPSNKRILSLQGNIPSPLCKKKVPSQVLPKSNLGSPLSAFSQSSWSSPISINNNENGSAGPSSSSQSPYIEKIKMKRSHGSFNLRLMNNYLCFSGHGIAVENAKNRQGLVDVV